MGQKQRTKVKEKKRVLDRRNEVRAHRRHWTARLKGGNIKVKLTSKSVKSEMKILARSMEKEPGARHVFICGNCEPGTRQGIIYSQYQGKH